MSISKAISQALTQSSWIRRMFEDGINMKRQFGDDQVFDFSLGNPIMEPPKAVIDHLQAIVNSDERGTHRYMPNAGLPIVREKIARYLQGKYHKAFTNAHVVMCVGAGGGLNVILKSILNPGDEVIYIAPFFPEYAFYVTNHGGKPVVAQSHENFSLDIAAISDAITPKTKAIIINTPNNPTGKVYDQDNLNALGLCLREKEKSLGQDIYLVVDSPYEKLIYDQKPLPDIFSIHDNTLYVTSHSKDLGLAGERIGYIAIHPKLKDALIMQDALTFATRTLGFVNAPALMQRAIMNAQDVSVDIGAYKHLRDIFCSGLKEAGYQFERPQGAFYIFPKSPIEDDIAFTQKLKEEAKILTVPGSGFGRPGYFRLSFCVEEQTIRGAMNGFQTVRENCRN